MLIALPPELVKEFPRSADLGLIEAMLIALPPERVKEFPRSADLGLIEAIEVQPRRSSRLCFRDQLISASLKPAASHIVGIRAGVSEIS